MSWVIFPIALLIFLSNATSRAIGVLLPSLTNQVFAEVLRGIEAATDAHGYQTMLAHYGYKPEMEQERLESMLSWNIDGLILTERSHTPRTLKMIEVAGIPVVELMDSQSPCLDIAVGFDNFEAARQMTAAIIARGTVMLPILAHVLMNVLSSNRGATSRQCAMPTWCRTA